MLWYRLILMWLENWLAVLLLICTLCDLPCADLKSVMFASYLLLPVLPMLALNTRPRGCTKSFNLTVMLSCKVHMMRSFKLDAWSASALSPASLMRLFPSALSCSRYTPCSIVQLPMVTAMHSTTIHTDRLTLNLTVTPYIEYGKEVQDWFVGIGVPLCISRGQLKCQ